MKRIIYYAALVALLVTSCQKTDVLNVVEDTIDFTTNVGKLTKASYDDPKFATLKAQDFRVWAVADFDNGTIDKKGEIYRGMDNLTVKYTEKTIDNSPSFSWEIISPDNNKYFWPAAGNYLQFYTISAMDTEWLDSIVYKEEGKTSNFTTDTGITGLNLPVFTVKDDANDDIMVADHIRQDKSKKKVMPTFQHTMTKVEFNFKQGTATQDGAEEAAVVILKNIETVQLACKGTLEVTYSPDETQEMEATWTPREDKKPFTGNPTDKYTIVKKGGAIIQEVTSTDEITSPTEGQLCVIYDESKNASVSKYEADAWTVVEELTYEEASKEWTSEAADALYDTFYGVQLSTGDSYYNFVTWYMIPQTLNTVDGSHETVTISYVADGKHLEQDFKLKSNDATNWEEGACIRYNVTIAPHKIQFSPTVGDWNIYDADDKTEGDQEVEMQN